MENAKIEELLEKQQKTLEKQLSATRIVMIFNILLAVSLLVLTFSVLKVLPQLKTAMETVSQVAADAEQLLTDVKELSGESEKAISQINELLPDFSSASESIAEIAESLSEEGLPQLYSTLESLDSLKTLADIDIEALNDSIQSLHNVVAPLAKLFGN